MNDFYKTCPLSKPIAKKKKKKVNGWKDKPNRYCHYTGRPYAERHELFYGNPLRQISIHHGFQVDLCPPIHALFHGCADRQALKDLDIPGMFPNPEKWAKKELRKLRRNCQKRFEQDCMGEGMTAMEARDEWMELMGRDYLND